MRPAPPAGLQVQEPSDPAAELPPDAVTERGRPGPIAPREPAGPATPPFPPTVAPSGPIVPPYSDPTMALPPSPEGATEVLREPGSPTPPSAGGAGLSMADFEQLALQNNPTLVEAEAMVNVSRGRAWQAGLWPNPFLAYVADQVALPGPNAAALGEMQGFRVQQEIPVANKRRISRRKYEWEAETARWHAVGQQMRVLNGVRIRYFEVLAHQRIADYRHLLFKIADAGLRTTEEMVNVGQANQPDLLAAQIQRQQAEIDWINAQNQLRRAWVNLVTVVGVPELPQARLGGTLELAMPTLDYEESLWRLLRFSPHLLAAKAEVERDQVTVLREKVEPIPNLLVRVDQGYNFIEQEDQYNYFVGIDAPIWNRNQGTVLQAESDLARARANVRRVELSLTNRLADVFAQYSTALATERIFREQTLPRAQQAYQLLEESYRDKRAAWAQVLVAQRNWVELSIAYVNAAFELRRREIEIDGMLMVDGLDVPPGPHPLGHLNAVPTPR